MADGTATGRVRGKPRGRPFQPGQSGNPKGRKPRTEEDAYLLAAQRAVGVDEWEALVRVAYRAGLKGDSRAWYFLKDALPIPKDAYAAAAAKPTEPVLAFLELVTCPAQADAMEAEHAAESAARDGPAWPPAAIPLRNNEDLHD